MRNSLWLMIGAVTVPLILFANVWQVFRHDRYIEKLTELERDEEELLERNRRIISAIEVYDSPARVSRIAGETLGLEPVSPDNVILMTIGPGGSP
jgi:hypothetical protein